MTVTLRKFDFSKLNEWLDSALRSFVRQKLAPTVNALHICSLRSLELDYDFEIPYEITFDASEDNVIASKQPIRFIRIGVEIVVVLSGFGLVNDSTLRYRIQVCLEDILLKIRYDVGRDAAEFSFGVDFQALLWDVFSRNLRKFVSIT